MSFASQNSVRAQFGQLASASASNTNQGSSHTQAAQGYTAQPYSAPSYSEKSYARQPVSGGTQGGESLSVGRLVKGIRFVSGMIDMVVICGLFFVVAALDALYLPQNASPDQVSNSGAIVALGLLAVNLIYGIVMEASKFQGTLGKILTNTAITNFDGERISVGQSIGRNFGKLLSGLVPFYIPYIMVFTTDRNQSLHDYFSKTVVRKKLGGYGQSHETAAQVFA